MRGLGDSALQQQNAGGLNQGASGLPRLGRIEEEGWERGEARQCLLLCLGSRRQHMSLTGLQMVLSS